ncbi:hypothetical protein [uncultured Rubinisphaera sp.]|uniref:hypothetical protein n=1 Tax=uncultured Rubinisphaera sp. TaxID=1678686 RepID=UPI0030D76A3F|tara:strand:- start:44 stop:457 length:414 start_codon:yes stop_codon:yes gene_type:complete
MKIHNVTRVTIVICLLVSIVEIILSCTSTASLSRGDAAVIAFVIGPYLLMAIYAWIWRANPPASYLCLTIVLVLSTGGLYFFALDSYRYHTVPDYRKIQRMVVFLVPLFQWVVAMVAGFLIWGKAATRAKSGQDQNR